MTSRNIIALLLAFCLVPALFAAPKKTNKKKTTKEQTQKTTPQKQQKLTKLQQEQLKVYKQINTLCLQKKYNQELFFKSTYLPIQNACKEMVEKYRKLQEKLDKQIQALLDAGASDDKVKELTDRKKLFNESIKSLQGIQTAIDTKNPLKVHTSIEDHLKVEQEIKRKQLYTVKREWFTPKELESYTSNQDK